MIFDDVIDLYEHTKREQGHSLYYDKELDTVYSSKKNKEGSVLVDDTFSLCYTIIKHYLDEPAISTYKEECQKCLKKARNRVISFLWFFEHIDGTYDFELYETVFIRKLLVEYCKKNGLSYCDLDEYSVENHLHTFLTEKRLNQ